MKPLTDRQKREQTCSNGYLNRSERRVAGRGALGATRSKTLRVGLVVPSSNTTMETEIPEMFRRAEREHGTRVTFHSSRMRLLKVTAEELRKMDAQADRCALELADAGVDTLAYACLVAVMSQGPEYAEALEERLAALGGEEMNVITSACALIEGIRALGARRISMIAPYKKELTEMVVSCIEQAGIEVIDAISLEVTDNRQVGDLDPMALVDVAKKLNVRGADAVVLSACVQMPSLEAIPVVEATLGIPVLSAATATTYELLNSLGLPTVVRGAGALLSAVRPGHSKNPQQASMKRRGVVR